MFIDLPPFLNSAALARICALPALIRQKKPHIHALTSPVSQNLIANGLLAMGALPSLTVFHEEIESFIERADACLLNLGMLDQERLISLPLAAEIAQKHHKPCVLDPVFVEKSQKRQEFTKKLLRFCPQLIKLNQAEADLLTPFLPPPSFCVITGEKDLLQQGDYKIELGNGHVFLRQTTATGCLAGAVLAAALTVEPSPCLAAIGGLSLLNIAAEHAAEHAHGPGSFVPLLLDSLANITAEEIKTHLKIRCYRHKKVSP